MTDTYLLPEVHIVITQVPGVDGTPSTARLTQIENDLATILGRPAIEKLTDINDVIGTPVDGDTIIWNADDSEWIPGIPITGINVQRSGTPIASDVTTLNINQSMNVSDSGGGEVSVFPVWGTAANTFAQGNHTHTNPLPVFQPFNATGYMSGGTRQVVTRSVTLEAGISYVVVARLRPQFRGADAGTGYYTMTLNIAGNTKTSAGGATSGFWCVQGVPNKEEWVHARTIVGTGAAVTITGSVGYWGGAGFYVDAGELEIDLRPAR